jgi:excisionase family DNA binding protein
MGAGHVRPQAPSAPAEQEKMTHEPLTITVPEAGRRLGISRWAAYQAARRGEIPVVRIGALVRVPLRAFEAMLDRAMPREPAK